MDAYGCDAVNSTKVESVVSLNPQQRPHNRSRFFIALLPPPEVQAYATKIKEYFRDRYNSQAALRSPPHITLQAPFEWPMQDYTQLATTLANFRPKHVPIPIELSGFGAFPPRVIYLAVEHTAELMVLQADLSQYLAETLDIIDLQSRTRPFRPHLTVAFRDLKPATFRRAWPEFESRDIKFSGSVHELTLLIHTGKRWETHLNFPAP